MDALVQARGELKALRDHFYDLVDGPATIADKIEQVVHLAVAELDAHAARIAALESRLKALEDALAPKAPAVPPVPAPAVVVPSPVVNAQP